ncbi:MAG TPA: glycosyltransferase family 39 protein [Anaerolineaceae bacterium]|nr:glycosyltransferase family 39 protein [Anaerolineaceae bacterium]
MAFLLSIILLILTTLLFSAELRLKRWSEAILAWALVGFACLVFVFTIANQLKGLGSQQVVLGLQAGLLLVSAISWLLAQRPKIIPDSKVDINLGAFCKERKNWFLLILAICVAGVLLLSAVLNYIVPPNNNDALSYHVARIVRWMQQGSTSPWETPFVWQLSFPLNAQLVYLWTLLFTNSDHFIAFIPMIAGLLTSLIIYLLAQELGFSRRNAVFSALIWLTLPVVQLHLTSVRHDLISTWLFLSTFYFFHRWGKTREFAYLLLSALALALVVGTNFSIAAYLPGMALMLLLGFVFYRYSFKQVLQWVGVTLLCFLLFSSPIYVSNAIYFGSPLGPDAAQMTSAAVAEEMPLGKYIIVNATRWFYQLLDFSWLPQPVQQALVSAKAWLARLVFTPLGLNLEGDIATLDAHRFTWGRLYQLQEDEAWFGLIGGLLIFPTSLAAFVQGLKRKDILRIMPFVFFLTVLVTCSLIRPGWTPFDGRYFMPLAAMCTAFLPLWLQGKSAKGVEAIVVAVSIFSMAMVVLFNPAKQVIGGAAVWKMNRIDMLTRQSYSSKEMLYLAEAIPSGATVGVAAKPQNYQEYGLFGEDFSRKVVNIDPLENIADLNWLDARGVKYLLVNANDVGGLQPPQEFRYVDSLGDWILYQRDTPKSSQAWKGHQIGTIPAITISLLKP